MSLYIAYTQYWFQFLSTNSFLVALAVRIPAVILIVIVFGANVLSAQKMRADQGVQPMVKSPT